MIWGERRLRHALQKLATRSPQALIDGLIETMQQFCGEHSPDDDVTLVTCKVNQSFE